jgi:hypothetical protein
MGRRRDQHVGVVRGRRCGENARPRDARPECTPRESADGDAEQQVAEQVRLIEVQGERRHGAPPFARGAPPRIERASREPVGAECLDSRAIRDEHQQGGVDPGPDLRTGKGHEHRPRAPHGCALERITLELLARGRELPERHQSSHSAPSSTVS